MSKTILFNGYHLEVISAKAVGEYYRPTNMAEYLKNRPEPSFPRPKTQGGEKGRTIQLEFPTFRWTGTLPANKKVTISEVVTGNIESSTLVLPDGISIPGKVEVYSEAEKLKVATHLNKQQLNNFENSLAAGLGGFLAKLVEVQNAQAMKLEALAASNITLAEETRKPNANASILVRHAAKMEDAAREARTKPADAARDILWKVRKELTGRDSELLDMLEKTDGNQSKAGKNMDPPMSQPTVYRCITDVLRPAYAQADMELPRFLLNRAERMAMKLRADVSPTKRTASGDITRNALDDAADDE